MPVEATVRAPLVPAGRQFAGVLGEIGEPQILQIRQGGVAGVVHHHVQDDPHAALVGLVHQGLQALLVAVVGVNLGEVQRPVAVVGVEGEVALFATADEAVHLLHHGGDPDGVHAEGLDVVELLGQPLEVAAMPGGDLVLTIFLAAEAMVIGGIAVVEAVGQQEIDARLLPAEGRGFGRLDRLEQQQAAALLARCQGQLAALDHGFLSRVGIPQPGAIGPDPLQRYGDRAAIPLDAGLFGGLALELALLGRPQHLEAGGIRVEGELVVTGQHHPQGEARPLAALVHGLGCAEGERPGLGRPEAGAAAVARIGDADLVVPLVQPVGQGDGALVQRQRLGHRFAIHVEMHLGGGQRLTDEQWRGQQGEPQGGWAEIETRRGTHRPFLELSEEIGFR